MRKKEDKKIRILSVMLGTGVGGLENVFVDHARIFKKLGYHSSILCHQKSASFSRLSEQSDLPVYTTPSKSFYSPLSWYYLIKAVRTDRPDVLCMHGNRAVSFFTFPLMKCFIHPFPKLIATAHNNRNRRFYKLDGVFSISKLLKEHMIANFGVDKNKVFLCPNAAPTPKTLTQKSHTPLQIGFLGRLEPVKGCDVLLKACCLLKKKKIPFKLIIAGDGSQKKDYQEFIQKNNLTDNIDFIGWINDKAKFFSQIDIMCIPSRSEGQPLTLLESLSYKKPIVVSDCPGMLEVVSEEKAALSCPIEDEKALANQLSAFIQSPKTRDEFSKRAYATYTKSYTPYIQEQNLAKGIESVLKKN